MTELVLDIKIFLDLSSETYAKTHRIITRNLMIDYSNKEKSEEKDMTSHQSFPLSKFPNLYHGIDLNLKKIKHLKPSDQTKIELLHQSIKLINVYFRNDQKDLEKSSMHRNSYYFFFKTSDKSTFIKLPKIELLRYFLFRNDIVTDIIFDYSKSLNDYISDSSLFYDNNELILTANIKQASKRLTYNSLYLLSLINSDRNLNHLYRGVNKLIQNKKYCEYYSKACLNLDDILFPNIDLKINYTGHEETKLDQGGQIINLICIDRIISSDYKWPDQVKLFRTVQNKKRGKSHSESSNTSQYENKTEFRANLMENEMTEEGGNIEGPRELTKVFGDKIPPIQLDKINNQGNYSNHIINITADKKTLEKGNNSNLKTGFEEKHEIETMKFDVEFNVFYNHIIEKLKVIKDVKDIEVHIYEEKPDLPGKYNHIKVHFNGNFKNILGIRFKFLEEIINVIFIQDSWILILIPKASERNSIEINRFWIEQNFSRVARRSPVNWKKTNGNKYYYSESINYDMKRILSRRITSSTGIIDHNISKLKLEEYINTMKDAIIIFLESYLK